MGSFLVIESNEQKTAAYLGFGDTCHLRRLAVTWPVLRAYVAFDTISTNMNKKSAMHMLYDNEEEFKGADYKGLWPLLNEDSEEETKNKKSRHLACILLQMEADILSLDKLDSTDSMERHWSISDVWTKTYPGKIIPELEYLTPSSTADSHCVRLPTLIFAVEHRMEAINRCWSILRYLRYCCQSAKIWPQRFSPASLLNGSIIDESHVPNWLLPTKKDEPYTALKKTAAVAIADALPPKKITIIWDIDDDFDGKEDLDDALAKARAQNIKIPNSKQT